MAGAATPTSRRPRRYHLTACLARRSHHGRRLQFQEQDHARRSADHVDTINAALALLRRFLDWDRAWCAASTNSMRRSRTRRFGTIPRRRRMSCANAAVSTRRSRATRSIEKEMGDTVELIELAEMEGDEALVDDAVQSLAMLAARAEEDKIKALLAGEADSYDCYIEVFTPMPAAPKADWAEMLQRMYMRWAEKRGMKVELIEYQAGEQAASNRRRCWSWARMPMATSKAAFTASSAFRPTTARRAATPAFPASGSIR